MLIPTDNTLKKSTITSDQFLEQVMSEIQKK